MSAIFYVQENGQHREANEQETKSILEIQKKALEEQRLFEAEQEAKAQARNSALAKLAALGLTEAEIAAL